MNVVQTVNEINGVNCITWSVWWPEKHKFFNHSRKSDASMREMCSFQTDEEIQTELLVCLQLRGLLPRGALQSHRAAVQPDAPAAAVVWTCWGAAVCLPGSWRWPAAGGDAQHQTAGEDGGKRKRSTHSCICYFHMYNLYWCSDSVHRYTINTNFAQGHLDI